MPTSRHRQSAHQSLSQARATIRAARQAVERRRASAGSSDPLPAGSRGANVRMVAGTRRNSASSGDSSPRPAEAEPEQEASDRTPALELSHALRRVFLTRIGEWF